MLFKSLQEEISSLQEEIISLKVELSNVPNKSSASVPNKSSASSRDEESGSSRPTWRQLATAVFAAFLVLIVSNQTIFLTERLRNEFDPETASILWLLFIDMAQAVSITGFYFGALLVGAWVARTWRGTHFLIYVLLGLIVGTLMLPTSLGLEELFWEMGTINWPWAVSVLLIMPAAMFVSGGLLGDLTEIGIAGRVSWRAPIRAAKSITKQILSDRKLILRVLGAIGTAIVGAAAKPIFEPIFQQLFR